MTSSTTIGELSTLQLFEGCAPDDLRRVSETIADTVSIPEGSVICAEGELADRWWIVVDGLADATSGGRYVATIGPGETIGELALLDGAPRNATVAATTDMVVHVVDGRGFADALRESPGLAVALLRELAIRLRRSTDRAVGSKPPATGAGATPVGTSAVPVPVSPQPVVFDPFAPGYFTNPYEQYAALRDHAPVHHSEATGAYLLTRQADVHRLNRDRSLMVSIDVATSTPAIDAERARIAAGRGNITRNMLRMDGDDHTRLRRLVAKVFTPRAIAEWRERAETVVGGLLDAASQRDEIDVIADYALLVPAQIISEMLGMPRADIPKLRGWSHAVTKTLDPLNTPEEIAASIEAARAMVGYISDVIEDKRSHPADDILSDLIAAEEGGDRLTGEELRAQVFLLYVAGHETTLNLIGNGLTHLFEAPDQLDLWRSDPSLDANGIEEMLRFDSPVQFARRIAAVDVAVDGVTIPAGAVVSLGLGAANRDPRKWGPTADRVDISRPGANEHASFGGGVHYCLGSALARLEGQIALPRLIRRFPHMLPAYDEPAWSRRMVLRGVERLPVSLRADAR